jgi:hypothetical protein
LYDAIKKKVSEMYGDFGVAAIKAGFSGTNKIYLFQMFSI